MKNHSMKNVIDTMRASNYFNAWHDVLLSEYIDEFFRYCKKDKNRHKIKNNIAQAYLGQKLNDDSRLISEELNKALPISLESKQELINAHMNWMQHFINTVLGVPQYFELDPTKCFVGRWLIKEAKMYRHL